LAADVVNDLQHPDTKGWILDIELLTQTAVVHQIGARVLKPTVVLKSDLGIGNELPYDVG
jgi:hypothetical protein